MHIFLSYFFILYLLLICLCCYTSNLERRNCNVTPWGSIKYLILITHETTVRAVGFFKNVPNEVVNYYYLKASM